MFPKLDDINHKLIPFFTLLVPPIWTERTDWGGVRAQRDTGGDRFGHMPATLQDALVLLVKMLVARTSRAIN